MPQERFRETGKDSFFGDLVYDRVVPKTTSSASSTRWWIGVPSPRSWCGTTKGATEYGPPPYEPVLLLKMLLLSYLYDLSERQTEDLVSYHLPAKWFVGLAVDEAAPDHASLTVFKQRLLARRGAQGKKRRRDASGQPQVQREYFFGYKAHVSMNAEAGIITSLTFTPGNAYDGHQLPALVGP